MFYCTLYYAPSRAFKITKTVFSVYYESKADAERFRDLHINRAKELGATVIEENGYYKITGKIALSVTRLFSAKNKSATNTYYVIGIEDDETKGSLNPTHRSSSYIDGHKYEQSIAGWRKRADERNKAEQEIKDRNLARFEKELKETNDLTTILTLLIKYAGQKTDKDKVIQVAVNKIQGNTTSWYDELSDINN